MVCSTNDDAGAMPKRLFTQEHFNWQDDRPPRYRWTKMEFKEMVRAFHETGIEVILDVMFNHTAVGN